MVWGQVSPGLPSSRHITGEILFFPCCILASHFFLCGETSLLRWRPTEQKALPLSYKENLKKKKQPEIYFIYHEIHFKSVQFSSSGCIHKTHHRLIPEHSHHPMPVSSQSLLTSQPQVPPKLLGTTDVLPVPVGPCPGYFTQMASYNMCPFTSGFSP